MRKSANSSKRSTKTDRRSEFINSIKLKELDPEAFTRGDIMNAKGIDRNLVERLIEDNLAMGAWEQVWKKGPTRIQKAYRLVKPL